MDMSMLWRLINLDAIRDNKVEEVERVLNYGNIDINQEIQCGSTPLYCAVKGGHENIVILLLERGADINIKDWWGRTPLHWAAEEGHENIVRFLLERGADPNIKDEDGSTPLHCAVRSCGFVRPSLEKRENIVRLLLERGVDPSIKDKKGETPRNLAEKQGFQNIQDLCQRLTAAPVQAYLLREMIIYLTRELVPLKHIRMLARERLSIPDAMLDNLEYNYSQDAEEQAYQIMWLWKERTAGSTVYDLFKALKDHQLNDSLDQIHCKFRDRVRDILNRSDDEFKEWLQPTMTPTNGVDLSEMITMEERYSISRDMAHLCLHLENVNDKKNENTAQAFLVYHLAGKGVCDDSTTFVKMCD